MTKTNFKILIAGGGTGGIAAAARLARLGFKGDIGIIEPSKNHYYQPYWTMAGVGQVPKEQSQRSEESLIPKGVHWIKDSVTKFLPEQNQIETAHSGKLTYDILLVALGLELNFEKIKGLEGHLGKNNLITVYQYDQLEAAKNAIQTFKGGTAIFTMPPVPIKCAGAPQKVMYLADDIWRRRGVRDQSKMIFTTAGASIFGVKEFATALTKVAQRKNIETRFQRKLVEVLPQQKIAVFESTEPSEARAVLREEISYDLLHVVPPMSAPRIIQDSPLASKEESQKGWLAVNQFTLQNETYKNVFGIGDVTGIPNSKTGAAIRKQAPIVAENIRRVLTKNPNLMAYDGYASCPLITGIGKVILAEFGYGGKLLPSFPLDPTKERRLFWHLKKDLLPPMYWYGMLRGRM